MSLFEEGGIATVESKEEKRGGLFSKVKKVFSKDEGEFTAERAWLESTYGEGTVLTLDERIANKQSDIKVAIKSKFRHTNSNIDYRTTYSSYHCVVDIEEDLAAYKEIILQPFIDKGFKIVNLSEQVNEIEDENVYLISWKHVFNKS